MFLWDFHCLKRAEHFLFAFTLAWVGFLMPVHATVWKFVDNNGLTQFTNTEPPKGAVVVVDSDSTSTRAQEPLRAGMDTSEHDALARRTVNILQTNTTYLKVHANLSDASSAYGVDLNLIKAVAASESAFNPNAVSRKGAVGLMQVMPATARQYGVMAEPGSTVARKLTNPELNIHTGTKYLSYLLRLYGGQVDLALAAYNAGEGAVLKAGNQIPDYKETQDYVRKVLAVYKVLQTRPV